MGKKSVQTRVNGYPSQRACEKDQWMGNSCYRKRGYVGEAEAENYFYPINLAQTDFYLHFSLTA